MTRQELDKIVEEWKDTQTIDHRFAEIIQLAYEGIIVREKKEKELKTAIEMMKYVSDGSLYDDDNDLHPMKEPLLYSSNEEGE